MSENTSDLLRFLDDGDYLHLTTAFRTKERIDFIDVCQKFRPSTFARVHINFFAVIERSKASIVVFTG